MTADRDVILVCGPPGAGKSTFARDRFPGYTIYDMDDSQLRAAGYRTIASRPARPGWDSMARPRDDAAYQSTERTLWEAPTPPPHHAR